MIKTSLSLTAVCLGVAILAAAEGCGDSTAPPTVANLIIVPDTIRVGRLDSVHLTVSAVDAGGRAVPGATITFASSDTTLLRVGPSGWVRSVGPVGATIVTVAAQSVSRPIAAFVLALPRTIVLAPDTTLPQRGAFFLRTTVRDGAGDPIAGAPLTFESLNPGVLSVSTTGLVTTVGPAGAGVVVAHSGTLADSAAITVTAVAESIVVTPTQVAAHQGDSVQFTAVVRDRNADIMAGATVTWVSSDTIVATVTSGGLARARNGGNTFISALYQAAVRSVPFAVIDSNIVARLPLSQRPLGVAVIGNRAYISRLDAGRVQVLSLATTAFTDSFTVGAFPCFFAVNSTGTTAYLANLGSQTISIINVATNQQTSTIPVHGDPLPVALSPNDSMLFVTTNLDRLYKIDLATNTAVDSLPLPATSHHLVAHPNDTLLYVATREAGSVLEVNWRTMTVVRTFTLGGETNGLTLAPDQSELYVTNDFTNELHVIRLSDGNTTDIPLAGGAYSVTLDATGNQLFVGLLFAGKIQVIDRVAHTTARTIVTGGVVREMSLDAARQHIVVANESGWVDIVR